MVKVVFTFDVPEEKQEEYLAATKDKIKPCWESHGCQSYELWQADGENSYMKEMIFVDENSMGKAMALAGTDDEVKSAIELWMSFAVNPVRKTYTKKT
jgi:quinol monooxygenase YgiN